MEAYEHGWQWHPHSVNIVEKPTKPKTVIAMEEYCKHFSHEHPLQYVDPRFHKSRVCSACKHTIAKNAFFYQCTLCNFSLHKVCYNMPNKVTHPSDQNHNLTLQSITDQSNDCTACGTRIHGFYYSCTKCSLYCHMLCVALPLSVKIPSSHPHVLELELEPPYDFRCDLCDKASYSGWLYRCRLCEFDAHVSCAVKGTQSCHHQIRISDSECRQHEVMELLSQVMKGIEGKNVDHGDDQQSVSVTEDLIMPSYQFSDACFSIDISNLGASKHGVKNGIGSHVWEELGPQDSLKLKDHVENGTMRRSFWSKLLMCS